MLQYTGHPFTDVGVATITAFANKSSPSDVTEEDLEAIADYIETNYTRNPLRSFLTVAFTSNAWFAQDAYNPDKPGLSESERQARRDTRHLWANRHLRSWTDRSGADTDQKCIFTGAAALHDRLSGTLPPGRAGRAQVPLLQGDDNINFYPGGNTGVPISGLALLCLQAFPLGCAKVAGSLLAVHTDDADLLLEFARRNLDQNLRAVSLAQHSGTDKMPESKQSLGTFLIGSLLDLEARRVDVADRAPAAPSVTAYLVNNGKTPRLDIFHLPLQVTSFLQKVTAARYRGHWEALIERAWQRPKKVKRSATAPTDDGELRRNYLLEDVLTLPDQAPRFLRRYFLRSALPQARDGDPRGSYSPVREAALISWDLSQLFLLEVFRMDLIRTNAIRELADRLAAYVAAENDRRLFRALLTETRYGQFRLALIRADLDAVRRGQSPLITFEQFLEIFEEGEEVERSDWRLARDLVLIRVIEQLHANGWLTRHTEELSATVEALADEDTLVPAGTSSRV